MTKSRKAAPNAIPARKTPRRRDPHLRRSDRHLPPAARTRTRRLPRRVQRQPPRSRTGHGQGLLPLRLRHGPHQLLRRLPLYAEEVRLRRQGRRIQHPRRPTRRQPEARLRPLRPRLRRSHRRDDGTPPRRRQRVRYVRRPRRAGNSPRRRRRRRHTHRDPDGPRRGRHRHPRRKERHSPTRLRHHGLRPRPARILHHDGRNPRAPPSPN